MYVYAILAIALTCTAPQGMRLVPGGTFIMGSDAPESRADERPAHQVQVDAFWIDETEVTNAQFAAFVEATGYVTTAERPIDWEQLAAQLPPGTPKSPDSQLVPGSAVFIPPGHPVDPRDFLQWWSWTPGANWQHPEGPGSSLEGRENFPVVHVSWDDASAYATWAGKQLPTEAQWERAARFGQDGAPLTWGSELTPNGRHMANIWQGTFPNENTAEDGFVGVAPVKSFPPNDLGLFDMAGNVWEWTEDRYRPDTYRRLVADLAPGAYCANPVGPIDTLDPRNPFAGDTRIQKGGSHLCHASYCSSYRPSARMATTPDSSLGHVGFRCVKTTEHPAAVELNAPAELLRPGRTSEQNSE